MNANNTKQAHNRQNIKLPVGLSLVLLVPYFLMLGSGCSPIRLSLPQTAEPISSLEHMVRKTMQTGNIPALALAIVKDDKVVYRQLFQKSSFQNSGHSLQLNTPPCYWIAI